MSKYTNFDNATRKKSSKLCKLFSDIEKSDNNKRSEIMKMVSSYSITSPYSKIQDFNSKTKVVCENTDLSMFFDQCKVIFIGDEKCGKTSLVNRFTLSSFEQEYKPTLDINYNLKYFDVLNTEYNVGFWDMPGQESLKLITRSHFKNANVIVVVFDLTRPQTLMNAIKWMEEALAENDKSNPLRFIVGNKSDLLSKKAFEGLEAHARIIAQDLDAEYISVSSKEGTEVNNLFRRFTSLAFDKSVQKLIMPSDYNKVKNNISKLGTFKQDEKKRKNFWMWLTNCL